MLWRRRDREPSAPITLPNLEQLIGVLVQGNDQLWRGAWCLRVSARTCNVQNSDYQLPQSPFLVSVQLRLSMAGYNFARSSGHGYTLDPASKQSTALFSRCSHRSRSPLQPGEGPPSATAVVPSTSRGYGLRALPLVAGCSGNMTVTLRDSTVARVSIVPPHSAECSEFAARWSGPHSYPLIACAHSQCRPKS
jgi:hypothetical protein